MSRVQLALYKGPPSTDDIVHVITHYAIIIRSLKRFSHCELVIDGICHSSSARDGGVRKKTIDLTDGKWVIIDLPKADAEYALEQFRLTEGNKYDWFGIIRFILPFVKQKDNQEFCSEIVGRMLGYNPPEDLFPGDFQDLVENLR